MAGEMARMLREGVEGLVGVMEKRCKEETNGAGGKATGDTGAGNGDGDDKTRGEEEGKEKADEMQDESTEVTEEEDEMEDDIPSVGGKDEEDTMQDVERRIDGKQEERTENPTLLVAKEVLRRAEGLVERAESVKQTIEGWRRKGLLEGKWKSVWAL